MTRQRGGRGLAVRSGNSDGFSLEERGREFEFANHWNAASMHRTEQIEVGGDTR